jgi:hypothetical protein
VRRVAVVGGLVVACLALALVDVVPARAGDRPLEVLLVNMAPAGLRQDCMRVVQRVIRREGASFRRDGANFHRIGAERTRELAGHRDDGSHFTTWRAEDLDAVVRVVRAEQIDAVVLIDCRAEEGRVDAWVRAPSGGVARLRLRRTVIDDARAEWLARAILLQAWNGFSP